MNGPGGPAGPGGPPPGYGPPPGRPGPYGPYGQPYPPPYRPPPYAHRQPPPPPRAPATFTVGVHRLHWATVPILALYGFAVYLLAGSLLLLQLFGGWGWLIGSMVASVVVVAGALLAWWMVRFRIDGNDLVVETGLVRRRSRQIPLSRLQAVDISAPLVARMFDLADVRVELAGGEVSFVKLRYLSKPVADRLRAELLAHAAGLGALTPEAPERRFYKVPFGTLLGSLLLTLPVLLSGLLFFVLLVLMFAWGEPALLAGSIPALIVLLRGVLAPMLQFSNCSIAVSPDGLRLRYGLMATRMQTLPPGRIHAIRLVEPAMWRSFSWVRVDINVAGYAGRLKAASTTLLPVAPRRVAIALVNWVFPGAAIESVRLLDAKVSSSTRAAGTDDVVFAARHGLVRRTLDVIAHARVQSVRLTSGPLERLRGAATVHLDSADGPVRVSARGRDVEEARVIVESEAERARRARALGAPERWAQPPLTSPP